MRHSILLLPFLLSISQAAESEFQKLYKEQHSQREKETPQQVIQNHAQGAQKVASDQDELSADIQEIIQGETDDKVISFFAEAEELMNQSTDKLEALDTSGATIAISTEIVEKIHDAAKEKQKSSAAGEGKQSALMEMMKQMMGKGEQAGSKPGQGPGGNSGGEGQEADSSTANQQNSGENDGTKEIRRLPRKSGSAGTVLPSEFNKALDAYNKALTDSN